MVLHPHGGHHVRRRAAERRAEARGLGFARTARASSPTRSAARSSRWTAGSSGTLVAPASYFMKSPPIQIHDDIAFNRVEAFIRGDDNETLVGTEAAQGAQAAPPREGHDAASAGRRHGRAATGSAEGGRRRRPDGRPMTGTTPAAVRRRMRARSRRPLTTAQPPDGGPRASSAALVERHHATTGGSRVVERTGVAGYRLVRGIVGRLPARPAWIVLGWSRSSAICSGRRSGAGST